MRPKLLFFPFALIVFVWSFVSLTKPTWTEYQNGKEKLQKLITEKQSLTSGIANIKKALAQFQQIPEDTKKKVYNAMPQSVDNDNLVAEINKNASQSGVMIIKIGTKKSTNRNTSKCKSVTTSKKGSSVKASCFLTAVPVSVGLSAIGTYPMVKDFLNKLDTQNRVIVPRDFSLSGVNSSQSGNNKQNQNEIDLVSAKVSFDVFQKQQNSKVVLSKAIDNDKVLKSLLSGGLNKKGLNALDNMITSEMFYPVTVEGAGKEDLFKQTAETTGVIENVQ